MKNYKYTDNNGTFKLENPELTSYLYLPLANEEGMMSSITPDLNGDCKINHNAFLLEPVSSENLHNNKSSRNFWCVLEDKTPWSALGKSAKQQSELFTNEKEETSLEAGILYQQLQRKSKTVGLQANISSFIPCTGEKIELTKFEIKNISKKEISFSPVAAIPIYGRSANNIRDHRHVTSLLHRISVVENGVIVRPTMSFDERGHQANDISYGVFGACDGENPISFYPTVEGFIGEGGSLENPKSLIEDIGSAKEKGYSINGYEAIGALRFEKVSLQPGDKKVYIIALAISEEELELNDKVSTLLSQEQFNNKLEETKKYWNEKINIRLNTSDTEFNNWMHWVNFQPMLRRIFGCSFLPHHDYGKGGRGWRDLWQDCLALLCMDPGDVRQMLIDNFAGVRFDGTNATIIGSKQGEFIADRNDITRVWMDHGAWPLITTNFYIQQTGDVEILVDGQSYFKDLQVVRGEQKDSKWSNEYGNKLKTMNESVYKGSILEHMLIQHLTVFLDVGEHNKMRLRGADWNDALDMAEERGESVAFTALYGSNFITLSNLVNELSNKGIDYIYLAKELKDLLEIDLDDCDNIKQKHNLLYKFCENNQHTVSGEKVKISSKELSDYLTQIGKWIIEDVRNTEWINDKENGWFNGYYDNSGNRVEGRQGDLVRMMLTSQVFTIMSDVATEEQIQDIVKSVDSNLYDPEVGGYRLNTDFKEVKMDLGRMFGFAYGHKENGAVFAHMAVMYANALYSRGYAKEGLKVIDSIYKQCQNFEKSKIYPGIPEYFDANGRGMYHFLTGSASWLMLTVLTEMFGVKGKMGDLMLEPRLQKHQFNENGEASIDLTFANRKLKVVYLNPDLLDYGEYKVKKVKLNNIEKESNTIIRDEILDLDQTKQHEIIVRLGR
ncbi:MAG TPA: cellobiose phosphorylase [Clostridiales bacterium]|nr:cellobiose phosphorylase [Clostridiales bacterium]